MSSEKFTATSPEQLAEDLTHFLYERDRAFATEKADVSRHVAERELRVMAGDDSDDVLELCDQERIVLTGFRNYFVPGKKVPRPSDFTIVHRTVSQIDTLPYQLRHVLDAKLVEQYDTTESGDLNEVRQTEYGVIIDPDGEVSIGRDISYRLRDIKHVLYKARESKRPRTEHVYVPTEDKYLSVRTAPLPEAIDDPLLWAQVGEAFDGLAAAQEVDFEQYWLDVERSVQVACINALINSFQTGRPVKDVI